MWAMHSARLRFSTSASMVAVEGTTASCIGHSSSLVDLPRSLAPGARPRGIVQRYEMRLCPLVMPGDGTTARLFAAASESILSHHEKHPGCRFRAAPIVVLLGGRGSESDPSPVAVEDR